MKYYLGLLSTPHVSCPMGEGLGANLLAELETVKEYRIKGAGEQYLKITKETHDGFSVVITRMESGWKEEVKEFLPRNLFETCLRTDYLTPLGA